MSAKMSAVDFSSKLWEFFYFLSRLPQGNQPGQGKCEHKGGLCGSFLMSSPLPITVVSQKFCTPCDTIQCAGKTVSV